MHNHTPPFLNTEIHTSWVILNSSTNVEENNEISGYTDIELWPSHYTGVVLNVTCVSWYLMSLINTNSL